MNEDYLQTAFWTGLIIGGLTFIGVWIYCISEYDFIMGVGLGWLPALIVGCVAGAVTGFLWPLTLMGIVALFIFMIKN